MVLKMARVVGSKKIKWLLIILILLIMVCALIYLGNLKWSNVDITNKRLFVMYWKEYLIGGFIYLAGYISIQELLDRM